MKNTTLFTFTSSVGSVATSTQGIQDLIATEGCLSEDVKNRAKVAFCRSSHRFPDGKPYQVFGVRVPSEALGDNDIQGADEAAVCLLGAFKASGISVSPWLIVEQTKGPFRRNAQLTVDLDAGKIIHTMEDCPATASSLGAYTVDAPRFRAMSPSS